MQNTLGDKGDTAGNKVKDTVGAGGRHSGRHSGKQWKTRFQVPEPSAYMLEEGEVAIAPPASRDDPTAFCFRQAARLGNK